MSNQIPIDEKLIKYLRTKGYRSDNIIDNLVRETLALGNIARMQIAPEQGQFLEIIVSITKSNKCLEVGRFTGLSSLCIAKGLTENGKLVSIDNSDEFLSLAQKYWKLAGVDSKIESVIGDAVEVMQSMVDRQHSFDFIFIDADKSNYPHYYELSLQLIPTNGIIIIDNMLWHGDVANEAIKDTKTQTIRELNLKIQKDDRINYSLLPLSDGLSFIQKK
tara:strand:- start:860 stop:1516 length:657 start_codon:yes stop_codon:yes gene_type:complete